MVETIIIPEVNIEVTKLKEWTKPYNEIVCPKGFRKIKLWEVIYILESDYSDEFLGEFKDRYNWIWCEQTKYDKKNGYATAWGVDRLGDGAGSISGADLGSGIGRFAFVKSCTTK